LTEILMRAFLVMLVACAFAGCAGQSEEGSNTKQEESTTAPSPPPKKPDGAAKAAHTPPELALGEGMTDPRSGLEIEVDEAVIA
jgi:hypothetical protein